MMKRFVRARHGYRRVAALALPALFCALAPLCAGAARAETDAAVPAVGDCSDTALRAEIRLCDLGYSVRVVNGLWEQEDADALSRFALAAELTRDRILAGLFSSGAPAAAKAPLSLPQGEALAAIGSPMPWEEVKTQLVEGQAYDITSCYSGITLHLVYVSAANHARMRPVLEWDDATLRGFFVDGGSAAKQPVVVVIDGIRVAASVQLAPSADGGATFAVFFTGSRSDIGALPDAEHDRVVAVAGGG